MFQKLLLPCVKLFAVVLAFFVGLWFLFLYANWPIVLAEDGDVCPDGSVLGAVDLCVNYTSNYNSPRCYGGSMELPCSCADGYTPYATRFYMWSEYYHFRCCSGGDGSSSQCGTRAYANVAGAVLMGIGIVGCLATTYAIHYPVRSRQVPLSEEDRAIGKPSDSTGEELHSRVAMEKWSVTKEDLLQFRRLVTHAILSGAIQPTDRDPFDRRDVVHGPSMYTVTEQFIKPVTNRAGGMSWALMKHPDGIPCDLFITHSWAEGVFEFLDKVISSWPYEAEGAYVCFLSNPQNLDIGGLISSPKESPFAKALDVASRMLVIPNLNGSIYRRIWCVYEAFLAYTWKKPIYTARATVPNFWLQISRVLLACMAYTGGAMSLVLRLDAFADDRGELAEDLLIYASLAILLVIMFFFKSHRHDTRAVQFFIFLFGATVIFARGMTAYRKSFKRSNNMSFYVFAALIAAGLEADRLLAVEGKKQSKQLKDGFHGIRDARSAILSDQERILAEIEAGNYEKQVNYAVAVLLDMNISVPELREVTQNVGSLGDVSTWSRTIFAFSLLWWITNPNQVYLGRVLEVYTDEQILPLALRYAMFVLAALESVVFLGMFAMMPPERKAFAEKAEWMAFFYSLLNFTGTFHGNYYELVYIFLINPLILSLSLAGPGRVSRIPCLGPCIVRLAFGWNPFRARVLQAPQVPELQRGQGFDAIEVKEVLEESYETYILRQLEEENVELAL